jgi:hypothetical protein
VGKAKIRFRHRSLASVIYTLRLAALG